jgi:ABC-type branched-subunit amino acid transport system ATPase component/branched-subunit amino acid ABC-type transport system permease component
LSDLLPFIIAGIVSGAVYGMAAVGLVLSYRTSGIFNFAHGALATLAAYVFYALHVREGVAWPIAAVISVLILGPALGISFERLARVLAGVSLIMQVAGTVGVLLVVEAACTQWYGSTPALYPNFLSQDQVAIGSTFVTVSQIITVAISVGLTTVLYVLFRSTRLGKAMRAVVDDPGLLAISGISPVRVRRSAWVIGAFFVTLSGLLLAPSVGLDASALTLLVVQAFGAAAIGRFRSLPMTWVGGLIIGVGSSVATDYVSSTSILGGIPTALPFIVLFGVLILLRQGGAGDIVARGEQVVRRFPLRAQAPGAVVVLAFLIAVPWLFPSNLTSWMTVLSDAILFLSLGLLVRASRQLSLCQITFAAIGAVAFSKLTGAGVPWLPALLIAGLVVVPIGALLAIPAVRLSGLYLALATLGFGLLVQAMFYSSSLMFGMENLGINMPRPTLSWLSLSSDRGFYFLLLFITVLTSAVIIWLLRGRLGGLLRVLGESPISLEAFGVNIMVTRIVVFCLSAFIAAIAGALSGMSLGTVTGLNFDPNMSLTLLVVVVITVGGEPWYALIGAVAVGLLPSYYTSQTATDVLQLIFGLGAVLFSLGIAPKLPGPVNRFVERLRRPATPLTATPLTATPLTATPLTAASPTAAMAPSGTKAARASGATTAQASSVPSCGANGTSPASTAELQANDVTVRFGGLVAVDHVTVAARAGRLTGVIGPNGAGKTTLFNSCSGLNTPSSGTVILDGKDVSHRRPSVRARLGLGRTFQQVQLSESLTVAENVRIGSEAAMVGASVLRHVLRRPSEVKETTARCVEAMELCGISHLAEVQVSTLPTGQRRLVELARCLAGPFTILLLDEPSSGLDVSETEAFGQLLRRVVEERGIGILLIEHDLSLTMRVCDEMYVLEFGRLIHHGSPESARDSAAVQAAYLGDAVLQ